MSDLAGLEAFARERIRPRPAPHDDAAARLEARALLTLMGEAGWCRFAVPAAHGGASEPVSLAALCAVREAVAAADHALGQRGDEASVAPGGRRRPGDGRLRDDRARGGLGRGVDDDARHE